VTEQFIGKGWAFPLGASSGGGIALASSDAELEQAIHLILGTAKGERPMRPEFGCAIHDYVFDPADLNTAGRLKSAVEAALAMWEPRIDVLNVDVSVDVVQRNCMYIEIRYAKKGTYDPRSLVFPFYVIPEED